MNGDTFMRRMATLPSAGSTLTNHECSWWLRHALNQVITELTTGRPPRSCGHVHPDGVGVVTLWQPDFLVCDRCTGLLRARGQEDHTCDRCRSVTDDVRPLLVRVGALVVAVGLCGICNRREVGA